MLRNRPSVGLPSYGGNLEEIKVPAVTEKSGQKTRQNRRHGPAVAITSLVMGLLFIVFYGVNAHDWGVFSLACILSAATLAAGGLLGFLFGIPRTRQEEL